MKHSHQPIAAYSCIFRTADESVEGIQYRGSWFGPGLGTGRTDETVSSNSGCASRPLVKQCAAANEERLVILLERGASHGVVLLRSQLLGCTHSNGVRYADLGIADIILISSRTECTQYVVALFNSIFRRRRHVPSTSA